MTRHHLLRPAATVLVSAALLGTVSAEAVSIRPMLKPGKEYRIRQAQTGETRIAMGELTMDQKMSMEMDMKIGTEAAEDGGIKASIGYEKVRTNIDMMGQKLEFDSENPDAANPLLGNALSSLIDLVVEAVYDKEGTVSSFKMVGGGASGGANPLTSGLGIGEEMFKQMAKDYSWDNYPKEPVEVGGTWTDEKKMPMGPMGEAVVAVEYKFVGTDAFKDGGPKLPKIEFTGELRESVSGKLPSGAAGGAAPGGVGLKIANLKMKGTMFFDPEAAFMRHSVTDVEMVAEMNNGETTMEIPTKQKITTDLLELKDAAE